MMMPSGSLLPERDARMRATASVGDPRVVQMAMLLCRRESRGKRQGA